MAGVWDPGKERREMRPIHPGSGRKQEEKKNRETTKQIPSLLAGLGQRGLRVLLGSGQSVRKGIHITQISLCGVV